MEDLIKLIQRYEHCDCYKKVIDMPRIQFSELQTKLTIRISCHLILITIRPPDGGLF